MLCQGINTSIASESATACESCLNIVQTTEKSSIPERVQKKMQLMMHDEGEQNLFNFPFEKLAKNKRQNSFNLPLQKKKTTTQTTKCIMHMSDVYTHRQNPSPSEDKKNSESHLLIITLKA